MIFKKVFNFDEKIKDFDERTKTFDENEGTSKNSMLIFKKPEFAIAL